MFDLTRQERLVLIFLALIILIGLSLHYSFKVNPSVWRMVNIISSDKLYKTIDINRATREELIGISGIGPVLADRIITYRRDNGYFTDLDELNSIKGIGSSNYSTITKYLKVYPQK